ncbi:hypothetical protein E2C01_083240 [Portunus trituberculatus]|uniref:Uncharacterized protein n=1 Tax=Portunus trituberculatus TaxID=210409 RepID=A0A5B7J179_PORTR|nr:hypothetical protein [Portunus trituberculatus]
MCSQRGGGGGGGSGGRQRRAERLHTSIFLNFSTHSLPPFYPPLPTHPHPHLLPLSSSHLYIMAGPSIGIILVSKN